MSSIPSALSCTAVPMPEIPAPTMMTSWSGRAECIDSSGAKAVMFMRRSPVRWSKPERRYQNRGDFEL